MSSSNSNRRAVIDIGTNSVKLLIGDIHEKCIVPILETSEQTRLGKDFYHTHQLQPEAIARTTRAVTHFIQIAARHGVHQPRLIATSAARDARNQTDLIQALATTTHLALEIISGRQEAEWAWLGVNSDPRLAGSPLLIMDTGGGSTQLVYHHPVMGLQSKSLSLGAVRLLETIPPSDPPASEQMRSCQTWVKDFLNLQAKVFLDSLLASTAPRSVQLVGTGGSSSLLAAMELQLASFDREAIERITLPASKVEYWMHHLWSLPLPARKQVPGLPASKADVILMSVVIHQTLMTHFDLAALRISTRGLRFGALLAGSE